ncbi:MAG: DUF3667 domain-containing protein [Bacteroidota bacterium]
MKDTPTSERTQSSRLFEKSHEYGAGDQQPAGRLKFDQLQQELKAYLRQESKLFFKTFWHMIIRPAEVVNYFLDGHRGKYYNPINFFFLIASVYAFSSAFLLKYQPTTKTLESIPDKEIGMFLSEAVKLSVEYGNIISFISVLAFALVHFVFFRKKEGYYYAEYLVLMMCTYSVGLVANMISGVALINVDPTFQMAYVAIFLPIYFGYFGWAFRSFFGLSWHKAFFRTTLVLVLGQLIYISVIGLVGAAVGYVYFQYQ